jgi:phosphoketolase
MSGRKRTPGPAAPPLPRPGMTGRERAPDLIAECESRIEQSVAYAHDHLEDPPEIRDWVWTD